MTEAATLTVAGRMLQVLDHLSVSRAHVCARSPLDVLDLVRAAPDRVASLVLQGAAGRPEDFGRLADRTLWLLGDAGETAKLMAPRLAGQPNVHWLRGYPEFMWSDTIANRTEEVSAAVDEFLARMEQTAAPPVVTLLGEGEVAEVTYRAAGAGTPVVLLPLGLSAHQWDPLLPLLQAGHSTVVLGGRHLQPVENLEARSAGDYSRMALAILELAGPRPGESLIEVGCGSGALLRRIARRYEQNAVTGLDVNSFLLREARALATREGLIDRLQFREGSAEAIPFADNTFDVTFSSTVMEEVDAERMMAELVRITRPGGRVAVVVRAIDRGQWTNLPLPDDLKRKIEFHSGGRAAKGCADESLCRRFQEAGLKQIRGGPAWSWVQPGDAWWRNQEITTRGYLTDAEYAAWSRALAAAQAEGLPVWSARPFHCAVGTK